MQIKEIISESPLKIVLRHIKDLDDLERSIRKSPAGIDKDTEQKINDRRKQLMRKKQELGEEGYDTQRDKDAVSGKSRKLSVGSGGGKPKGYSKDKAEKAAIDNVKKALAKKNVTEGQMSLKDMMKQREFYFTFKEYVKGNASIDQVAELVRGRVDKEQFANEVFKQGVRMGGTKGSRIKELANYIRKDSNVFDLPGKAFKKMKKMVGIGEEATAGATSAGNIATVANPVIAKHKPKKRGRYGAPQAPQKKKADGTATNALDVGNNLMGGKAIKR